MGKMKWLRALPLMLLFTGTISGCAVSTTTTRTWTAAGPGDAQWARNGYVEWVREVVHREQGNPAGGAIAGAIVGGVLGGGRGPGALFGATAGALIGAAASSHSSESRVFEVAVRFDDGSYQLFAYPNQTPFGPGELVMLTPNGLYKR
jgi:outer membrane lipoprotein SlyB